MATKGKRTVGLYLGANSVGAVVLENRKVISCAKFDISSLEEEAKVESLSEEVKWEALINKALREVGADEKEVSVSLADKDFIFRSFPMPLMKKREIESSLIYEIEKHIPFKIEELTWDYGYASFPKEKKINASFVGMKNDNFQKIKNIFSHLELNATIMEPCCLSLARTIKSLKQFSSVKNFAILDFTESEAYLTFFYEDLPVFNRYLSIPKAEASSTERLVESVRMSFQYFKREFKSYETDLDKLIVVGNSVTDNLLSSLKSELEIEVEGISPQDFIPEGTTYVENIKALGIAGRDYYPYRFKPVLKETKEAVEEEEIPVAAEVPLNLGLLGIFVGIGLLAVVGLYMFNENTRSSKINEIKRIEKGIKIPRELAKLSWDKRKKAYEEKKSKLELLSKAEKSSGDIAEFLDTLSDTAVLPKGLWLDSLRMNYETKRSGRGKKAEGQYRASVKGFIFRDNSFKEREGIDEFISNLKTQGAVNALFKNIRVISTDRKEVEGLELTSFTINLE